MKIGIFGLGYVGAVTGACLAHDGHTVFGIDPDTTKVDLINQGLPPVMEQALGDLIAEGVGNGRLRAFTDHREIFDEIEMAIVCVGTPSRPNGSLDLGYVSKVAGEIGESLRGSDRFVFVAVRSTVLPGTTSRVVIPILESTSGGQAGSDFGVAFCPEFLREGSSVADYYAPPRVVVGATDSQTTAAVANLFRGVDAERVFTTLETAEMVKYIDNAWHALKVGFANEVGRVGKALGVDSHDVMDIFLLDHKLNISEKYLRPGFAFGGSCLPKDLRALCYEARAHDVMLPILESVLPSNAHHIERALDLVMHLPGRRIGILGLSFKAGTDDLRYSPMVELVERLIGKGYDVRIHDPDVSLAALIGANREYLLDQIPHISSLLVDSVVEVVDHGDTIVIGTNHPSFEKALDIQKQGQAIVDLVRIRSNGGELEAYHGLCW